MPDFDKPFSTPPPLKLLASYSPPSVSHSPQQWELIASTPVLRTVSAMLPTRYHLISLASTPATTAWFIPYYQPTKLYGLNSFFSLQYLPTFFFSNFFLVASLIYIVRRLPLHIFALSIYFGAIKWFANVL